MKNGQTEYSDLEPTQPMNTGRRSLLAIFLATLGILFCFLSGLTFRFLKPPQKPNSFGGVIDAGTILDLPKLGTDPQQFPAGRFWLVHDDSGVKALHSSCTHLECLFSWDTQKQLFICPCHGSEFSKDGSVLKGPATRDLDKFPIILRKSDDTILRKSSNETGETLDVADLLQNVEQPEDEKILEEKVLPILVQVDTSNKILGAVHSSL